MKKRELLERDIEAYLRKKAMQAGCQPYKFVSPQRRSCPDQLILGSIEKVSALLLEYAPGSSRERRKIWAAKIMSETILFAECKKPGVKPSIAQEREHAKLRARGFTVLVVDSKEQIDEMYGDGQEGLI